MHKTNRVLVAGVLGLIAILGIAAGAYAGWLLWDPESAVLIWLVGGALLLVGGVLALVPRRASRLVGGGLLVAGIACLAGQALGPSRPDLVGATGMLELATVRPLVDSATFEATCRSDEAQTEMTLSGDLNMRLDVYGDVAGAPTDLDQREFVGAFIEVGDRWRDQLNTRADNVFVTIIISPVTAYKGGEVRLVATDASDLDLQWSRAGGSLRFAGLTTYGEDLRPTADQVDMAGTISWTCDV